MLKVLKVTAILEGISYLVLIANMLSLKKSSTVSHHSETFWVCLMVFVYYLSFFILIKKRKMDWPFRNYFSCIFNPFGTYRKKKL
jgi:hypothetical protein